MYQEKKSICTRQHKVAENMKQINRRIGVVEPKGYLCAFVICKGGCIIMKHNVEYMTKYFNYCILFAKDACGI